MSDIPAFSYDILWGERSVRSVANLTRKDGEDFFRIVEKIPLHTTTEIFPLGEAETALRKLRQGQLQGAAVLQVAVGGL
jgi:propanol-preferring alcohol dehydrogenase